MTPPPSKLLRFNRWLLFAMLGLLHLALLLGVGNELTRPLLFAHLGLFLMWQPLWRGESELRMGSMALIVVASIVALWFLNWWLLAFWVSGLFALVGGRVFAYQARWLRLLYLAIMAYLLMLMLIWVVPHLFAQHAPVDDMTQAMMKGVLPLLLAGLVFIPAEAMPAESGAHEIRRTVDFFYSLLLFMLMIVLVLGSLSFMLIGHVDYLEALLSTLFSMALVLFALGWLWNPRFGFTGLQPLFSRYLLNVGTPFESWLKQLAETAQHEPSPAAFLAEAATHFAALPWLSGVDWKAADGAGSLGLRSPYPVEIGEQGLRLTLYSRQRIGPAMLLHIHLLTQLLAHFYQAKQREQHLRDIARLQAIYETGSRLTHDLKNMLQSLLALTSIAQRNQEGSGQLVQRQLPVLTQRIELILGKLKAPEVEGDAAQLPLAVWWRNLCLRHQHEQIEWQCEHEVADIIVPAAFFDCVADNLIDNALAKRRLQPGIFIRCVLQAEPLRLAVCDGGSAIPEHLSSRLMNTLVPSENGLGVGLYQAARWAQQLDYRLVLRDNAEGRVCFELAKA